MEQPWPRPMSALSACALVLGAFALMFGWLQLLAAIIALTPRGSRLSPVWQSVSSDPLNVGVATALGIGSALWLGKAWHDPNATWSKLLCLRAPSWGVLGLAVLSGLALQVPLTELQNLAEGFFPIDPEQKLALFKMLSPTGWRRMLGTAFALVAIAPACEELLFRGLILQGLRTTYGRLQAVALSSVLFAVCHIRIAAAVFPACVAGVILGAIALRTRSTWSAVAVHAGINAAPLLLSENGLSVPGFDDAAAGVQHIPLPILLAASAAAAAALAALATIGGRPAGRDRANHEGA
jgi:membrane protease YdiL (CAAX protease family)